MRIDVVTLFPEMLHSFAEWGMVGRALQRGLASLHTWNPRVFTSDKHRSVDDRPYGGGPGMVMRYEPLSLAILAAKSADPRPVAVVYLSPQGRRLNQKIVREFAKRPRMLLSAGRYEGVDERLVEEAVQEECSIGDYVLSGGELPAMVLIEAVIRLLPEVLGDPESAHEDSFSTNLLDHPHYTRPARLDNGRSVPEVLLSGNHAAIQKFRQEKALERTQARRPDLLTTGETR